MAEIKMRRYVDQLKCIGPLGIYLGEMKTYVPERLTYNKAVYNSFVHNSEQLEKSQIFTNR